MIVHTYCSIFFVLQEISCLEHNSIEPVSRPEPSTQTYQHLPKLAIWRLILKSSDCQSFTTKFINLQCSQSIKAWYLRSNYSRMQMVCYVYSFTLQHCCRGTSKWNKEKTAWKNKIVKKENTGKIFIVWKIYILLSLTELQIKK